MLYIPVLRKGKPYKSPDDNRVAHLGVLVSSRGQDIAEAISERLARGARQKSIGAAS
jgi:hypothetical protein